MLECTLSRRHIRRGPACSAGVVIRHGGFDRLVQENLRRGELAGLEQRLSELRQQVQACRIAARKQLHRPAQQVRRRGHVAASQCAAAGGSQAHRAVLGDALAPCVERPELRKVGGGLLQVVADELLELAFAISLPGRPRAPGGEALVKLRAFALEQAAVRGVADQDVVEAVPVLCKCAGGGVDQLPGRYG